MLTLLGRDGGRFSCATCDATRRRLNRCGFAGYAAAAEPLFVIEGEPYWQCPTSLASALTGDATTAALHLSRGLIDGAALHEADAVMVDAVLIAHEMLMRVKATGVEARRSTGAAATREEEGGAGDAVVL